MKKRLFDLIASAVLLVISFPIICLLAVLVSIVSPGSPFYRQRRIGLQGKMFTVYKIRTMVEGADQIDVSSVNHGYDPRIIPGGSLLRKTKLDELPQLLNVLAGDMSLVGPRPKRMKTMRLITKEEREQILSVRPGLIGLAQLVQISCFPAHSILPMESVVKNDQVLLFNKLDSIYSLSYSMRLDLRLIRYVGRYLMRIDQVSSSQRCLPR